MKLLEIINVSLDVTEQLLNRYSAFFSYWKKEMEYMRQYHETVYETVPWDCTMRQYHESTKRQCNETVPWDSTMRQYNETVQWDSTSAIHRIQKSLWFSEEGSIVQNSHGVEVPMKLFTISKMCLNETYSKVHKVNICLIVFLLKML
jgi:hypothetical protein